MPRTCNGLSGLVEDRAESPLRVSNDCESTRRRGEDLMAKRLQQEKNGWGRAHLKAHPHLHAGQLMCPVARSAEPRRPSTVWAEHGSAMMLRVCVVSACISAHAQMQSVGGEERGSDHPPCQIDYVSWCGAVRCGCSVVQCGAG